MSKRAPGLERRARDFYATPREAMIPLVPHLPKVPTYYVEPCAGDGAIIRSLQELWPQGVCLVSLDIDPQSAGIVEGNALDLDFGLEGVMAANLIITNPPYPSGGSRGEPTLGLIRHLSAMRPTWMLLPYDFTANRYFGSVQDRCAKVVPVGRVSWMGNGTPGKDNSAWMLFDALHTGGPRVMARAAA